MHATLAFGTRCFPMSDPLGVWGCKMSSSQTSVGDRPNFPPNIVHVYRSLQRRRTVYSLALVFSPISLPLHRSLARSFALSITMPFSPSPALKASSSQALTIPPTYTSSLSFSLLSSASPVPSPFYISGVKAKVQARFLSTQFGFRRTRAVFF